mgnify:CR=1 FL=1
MLTLLAVLALHAAKEPMPPLIITQDTKLSQEMIPPGRRIVVKGSHLTIDGDGKTLVGLGKAGDLKSFQGVAIEIKDATNITLKNIKAKGWQTGLQGTNGSAWKLENCDFSDNYHDPEFDWGNGNRVGGIILTNVHRSTIRNCRANRVWNGLDLSRCDDNQVITSDFSHCSNVCLKMETACRNNISDCNLSYGIRIKPGEVHARDSTSVLIESGSNHNQFFRNDVRYGGDGIFIRVLNNWVSTGNLFVENDCSYANNNGFEAWSPGNTYIRNKSNHCSYGFWLGASDHTVLIGNEAGFNGRPEGKHNAPEPDFGHGGIVFVNGPSTHTIVEGNYCHDNNGGGIVLRGDRGSKGARWKAAHWILQNNRLENNKWGIFAMYAEDVHVANNSHKDNAAPDQFIQVTNLTQADDLTVTQAPKAILRGGHKAMAGVETGFNSSESTDPTGRKLTHRWRIDGKEFDGASVSHTFAQPGHYRVGLTVSNGVLADLAYRDVMVSRPVTHEYGTENALKAWTGEGDKIQIASDNDAVVGQTSTTFTPTPYSGSKITMHYRLSNEEKVHASAHSLLSFWMRYENRNPNGFQEPGPTVTLKSAKGDAVFRPVKGYDPLRDKEVSEARWLWQYLEIPIDGKDSAKWTRETHGTFSLKELETLSFSFDSWEMEPFTIWLDGMSFD